MHPTPEMKDHIHPPSFQFPLHRRWLSALDLLQYTTRIRLPPRVITLDGKLSGPPLRQGMIILQRDHLVYLQEEHGRWPTRDDHIFTTAISITQNVPFKLFIPIQYIERGYVYDESHRSLLDNPIPLAHLSNGLGRFKTFLPS